MQPCFHPCDFCETHTRRLANSVSEGGRILTKNFDRNMSPQPQEQGEEKTETGSRAPLFRVAKGIENSEEGHS